MSSAIEWHGAGVALVRQSSAGHRSLILFRSAETHLLELPFGGRETYHTSPSHTASEELFQETCALVEILPEDLELVSDPILVDDTIYRNVVYPILYEDFDKKTIPYGFARNVAALERLRQCGVTIPDCFAESISCVEVPLHLLPALRPEIRDRDWKMICAVLARLGQVR